MINSTYLFNSFQCLVLEPVGIEEPLLGGAEEDGLLGAPVVGVRVHEILLQLDIRLQQLQYPVRSFTKY